MAQIRSGWMWRWLVGPIVGVALTAGAAQAETNLLSNPILAPGSGAGSLPSGWSHQDVGGGRPVTRCPDTGLCASYLYGTDTDGQLYLDVSLNNPSSNTVYTNLFLGNPIAATSLDSYHLALKAQIVTDAVGRNVGLGFHLYDAGGYISETASDYSQRIGTSALTLTHHFQNVGPFAGTGRTPTQIQPRLTLYAPPSSLLNIRIKSPMLSNAVHLGSVGIDGRTGLARTLTAAPGKVLTFVASLQGRPSAPVVSYVTLVSTNGAVRSFNHDVSVVDPNLGDAWRISLPSDMPIGDYAIRYSLKYRATGGAVAMTLDDGVNAVPGSTSSFEIGKLKVSQQAGIAIGQHFHGHPGRVNGESRGTDPILVPYHFVRSHDSMITGAYWWREDTVNHNPNGVFDWLEFDRWATFHGVAGQKNLLITFFGSPTWASSKPTEPSPYGIPGLSAPPANLAAYQNMVRTTVSRYRNRIFATECWNEPSPTPGAFYTGTGTQLADICKAIYVATKTVSSTIPVICPAQANLNWLLTLKTTQGEPLHQFCDWVGAHPYNATGTDLAGADYSLDRLGDAVEDMEFQLRGMGLNKPIAVTEWGMFCNDRPAPRHPSHFHDMNSQDRGELLYQTLAKAKEKGLVALGLYSYDSGTTDSSDGSGATCRYGYEGIGLLDPLTGQYSYDAVAADGVTRAVRDFGKPLP